MFLQLLFFPEKSHLYFWSSRHQCCCHKRCSSCWETGAANSDIATELGKTTSGKSGVIVKSKCIYILFLVASIHKIVLHCDRNDTIVIFPLKKRKEPSFVVSQNKFAKKNISSLLFLVQMFFFSLFPCYEQPQSLHCVSWI